MKEVVAIGDSLTQFGSSMEYSGWVIHLQESLLRSAQVLNRGYSGYNTRWMKRYLPEIQKTIRDPILYILWLGANDASMKDPQRVPVEEYRQNMIDLINQLGDVVLITPPVVGQNDSRTKDNTILYRNACISVYEHFKNLPSHSEGRKRVFLIDTWEFIDESCLCDGLHLNVLGNSKVFKKVAETIKEALGPIDFYLPDWKTLQ